MITNKRIKELVVLNQKSKARREEAVFLVEGMKMFLDAPKERIREIYVSESFFATEECKKKMELLGYETVPAEVFKKISDTKTPQGILCVVEQKKQTMDQILQVENPTILLLEDLQDPGNLGTILRTGEGAAVTAVILSKGSVDIYNPKVIRSTMGSIYRVPFFYTENLEEVIRSLQQKKVTVYAAHLKGEYYYDEFDYTTAGGCAFLIGNEGNGLKEETAELADQYLKIPMAGKVESLNAAVASSILLYEAYRQKRRKE